MILSAESVARIREKMPLYPRRKSLILPAITIAHQQLGHLNDDVYREISEIIDIPFVEIAEAATFYTLFPKEPVGRNHIQVCHNISCALVGNDGLTEYLEQRLGIKRGETTPDRAFTLHTVECLGACATAPMMQINDNFYENLDRTKVDQILDEKRKNG